MNQIQTNYLTAQTLASALFADLPEDDQTPADAAAWTAWDDAQELLAIASRELIEWGMEVALKMTANAEDRNALELLKRKALRGSVTGDKIAACCMKLAA